MKKITIIICIIAVCGFIIFGATKQQFNFHSKIDATNNSNSKKEADTDTSYIEVTMMNDVSVAKPEDLYNYSSIVLLGDYTKDLETTIEKNGVIYTAMEFKIKKILKNENNDEVKDTIKVLRRGGMISLKDYEDSGHTGIREKIGAANYSDEELSKIKLNFVNQSVGDKSLKENKERIIFINYNDIIDKYVIVAGNFGMITYDNNNKVFDGTTKTYEKVSFFK